MNNIQKRFLLFLLGCIPVRAFFVYIATVVNKEVLRLLGYLALLPAIGFFYIYFTGSRNTGGEVFGDRIWWNNLRPIHGILYALFALNAIYGNKIAYIYLLVDVLFGLSSFLLFHYTNGNFEKLY
jgi:hypothetical protein